MAASQWLARQARLSAHNEIIRNAGARVKIWPMSVTALLGEALRWARGARVCNKPALFWRFGGAVAIWVCISFAYSTSSKTGSSTLAKHTPKTYPETDYRLFFLLEEKHVPKRTPKHTLCGELFGSWRGGTTTTTTAQKCPKTQTQAAIWPLCHEFLCYTLLEVAHRNMAGKAIWTCAFGMWKHIKHWHLQILGSCNQKR